MRKNKLILLAGLAVFAGLVAFGMWRELERNEGQIQSGISGVIKLAPGIGAGIVKTDNAFILLFDPKTLQPVAVSRPEVFVPPLTFHIGQINALEGVPPLYGAYRLLVVTDKDGNLERPSGSEYIGDLTPPIQLGTEAFEYVLNKPFEGLPRELMQQRPKASAADDPKTTISGTYSVAPALAANVSSSDRVIIMLFDPQKGRPVAIKTVDQFQDGQSFSIGQSDAMPGQTLSGSYSLRIITDKNNQPFASVDGEVVARSQTLIEAGTQGIQMVMDSAYQR